MTHLLQKKAALFISTYPIFLKLHRIFLNTNSDTTEEFSSEDAFLFLFYNLNLFFLVTN